MRKRGVALALVALIVIAFLLLRTQERDATPILNDADLKGEQVRSRLEEILGRTLPSNSDRLVLEDISETGFSAIVSREQEDNSVNISVLADLEEYTGSYQILSGPNKEDSKLLGDMVSLKGGFIYENIFPGDISDYDYFAISRQNETILEGSF